MAAVEEMIFIFSELSYNLDTQLGLCFLFQDFSISCVCRGLHKHTSRGRNQKEPGFSGAAAQSLSPSAPQGFEQEHGGGAN